MNVYWIAIGGLAMIAICIAAALFGAKKDPEDDNGTD